MPANVDEWYFEMGILQDVDQLSKGSHGYALLTRLSKA